MMIMINIINTPSFFRDNDDFIKLPNVQSKPYGQHLRNRGSVVNLHRVGAGPRHRLGEGPIKKLPHPSMIPSGKLT